jgi:hypothetical protein
MESPMSHPIVVTVICDGHRPDFVSDEMTPHMARHFSIGDTGVVCIHRHRLLADIAWTQGQYGRIADRARP